MLVAASWLLLAGCWLLALVASQGPGEGLESHFSLFLLTLGSFLVLGVDIGRHLEDPRLLRNLSEENFVAEVCFLSILSRFRYPLGSQFGDLLETISQLWMRKRELDWEVLF